MFFETLNYEGLTASVAAEHAAQIGAATAFLPKSITFHRVHEPIGDTKIYLWRLRFNGRFIGIAKPTPWQVLASAHVPTFTPEERLSVHTAWRAASGVAVMQGDQFPGDAGFWPPNDPRRSTKKER